MNVKFQDLKYGNPKLDYKEENNLLARLREILSNHMLI